VLAFQTLQAVVVTIVALDFPNIEARRRTAVTEATYNKFLTLAGEPIAAALLTLADAIGNKSDATPERSVLTVKEAAGALGISERLARDLIATGKLGHHRVGSGRGRIRVTPRDVQEYQSRGERPAFRHLRLRA